MTSNEKSSTTCGDVCNVGDAVSNLDCLGVFGGSPPEEPTYSSQKAAIASSSNLAGQDSLALQEMGTVVSEEMDVDEYVGDGKKDLAKQKRQMAMRLGLACVLLALVIVVAITARSNGGGSPEPTVVAKPEEGNEPPVPTMAPTVSPTSSLELTMEYKLLEPHVNPPSKLLDPTTAQGKAFQQIVSEEIVDGDFGFRIKQRFAMMTTFFATGGDTWAFRLGWSNFSDEECDWQGVALCRFRDGRRVVAKIQLPSNNLSGEIPEEICMLSDMETLRLGNNQLSGELPACLTDLRQLFELDVNDNNLNGIPPTGFASMPRLQSLDLSSNDFSGDLYSFLGETSDKLSVLRLDGNSFTGNPVDFANWGVLDELTLEETDVTGDASLLCDQLSLSIFTVDCSKIQCNASCCQCV